MPYIPLPIGDHIPAPVRALIESVVDGAWKEIRSIMEIGPPAEAGPKGHLQLSFVKLLLSAMDGAAPNVTRREPKPSAMATTLLHMRLS